MKSQIFPTPLGWAGAAVSDRGIIRIVLPKTNKKAVEQELAGAEKKAGPSAGNAGQVLKRAVILLRKYFSGEDVRFDLPIDIRCHTDFQQAVWRACMTIPYGERRSYAWIAEKIKKAGAARAVGRAMGANPVPILVP